jgi:two-component system LytT family response regulator
MRILIVDDERPARDKLRRMLEQAPGITAIDEARDGVEALERLPAFAPDLLLLDIQMPEINGLDVAASLPAPAPLVVFVTAYDDYAIRAFDANAIDYLLKPYDQPRLDRALQRVRERLAERQRAAAPDVIALAAMATSATLSTSSSLSTSATLSTAGAAGTAASSSSPATPGVPAPALPAPAQLLVPERGGMRVVRVEHIQWIETADNYVVLHTADGQPLMRQTLAGLLDRLGPRFVRCHRRAAVQLDWIAAIASLDKGDGELLLHSGARVPCSRQYRADVVERLQALAAGSPQRHPGSPHDAGR